MDADRLVKEFEACAALLNTPQGIYVVHRGHNFAEVAWNTVFFPRVSGDFVSMMQLKWVYPSQAPADILDQVSRECAQHHAMWMAQQYRERDFTGMAERCRWVGFAAGSLVFCGLAHFRGRDLFDSMDLPRARHIAHEEQRPYHNTVHLWLGYLYGWLWAAGKKSFNDFLKVSDAIGEPMREHDSRFAS